MTRSCTRRLPLSPLVLIDAATWVSDRHEVHRVPRAMLLLVSVTGERRLLLRPTASSRRSCVVYLARWASMRSTDEAQTTNDRNLCWANTMVFKGVVVTGSTLLADAAATRRALIAAGQLIQQGELQMPTTYHEDHDEHMKMAERSSGWLSMAHT
nr:hypothetical protein CFP56_72661 [Quercus suber]